MTEPTDAEIRGLAATGNGVYQDDETAIWEITDPSLMKLVHAALEKWRQPAQAAEPVAWLRNTTDPQPHAVTNLKYRSALQGAALHALIQHVFAAQADSQPAPQGETNAQLDTDSNPPTPGQQRDVAGPVALGQPVGNGSDQVAGHPSAQGDKLLTVAERNIRSFLRSAQFKGESDREAALNCVDVLWAAARAPADSVQEDAERYRWLRKQDWFDSTLCVLRDPKTVLTRGPQLGADCPSGTRLDAAIDAERTK